MTKEMKLRVHLEYIIFEDLPEGARLSAQALDVLCDCASEGQKQRAYERALVHNPLLLEDER